MALARRVRRSRVLGRVWHSGWCSLYTIALVTLASSMVPILGQQR